MSEGKSFHDHIHVTSDRKGATSNSRKSDSDRGQGRLTESSGSLNDV